MIRTYNDPTIVNWNTDSNGNRVSMQVTNELVQIIEGRGTLNGLPDEQHRVYIENFIEKGTNEWLEQGNEFKVDYTHGTITFHPDLKEQRVRVDEYYSRGQWLIPSARVWTKLGSSGEVEETFADIEHTITTVGRELKRLDNTIDSGRTLDKQIQSGIADGRSINLIINDSIAEAERLTGTVIDEETRKSNEIVRQSQESDRLSNEGVRISQEDIRSSNEDIRLAQEDSRVSTEQSRVNVESQRVVSEITRVDSENTRVQSELTRETQELDRQSQESIRVDNENSRDSNETSRKSNELDRQSSASAMAENESLRQSNEDSRIDVFGSQMDRIAEIEKLVPENVSVEILNLNRNIESYRRESLYEISEFKYITTTNIDVFEDSVNTRVDGINTRVDDIITTPTEEISVEEIVDARQGKSSLGANIQGVKQDLAEHKEDYTQNVFSLKNEVGNGNFEDKSGWTVSNSTFAIVNNIATVQPTAVYGRISQSIAASAGDILYAKYNVETANKTFEFAITDDVIYTHSYPINTGNSSVIMTIGEKSTSNRTVLMLRTRSSDFSIIKVSWLTIINLTKRFGKGNEPSQSEMDKLFKILPNQYIDESEVLSQEDILVWQNLKSVQQENELQDIHILRSYNNDVCDYYDGDKIIKKVGYVEIPLDWFEFYTKNSDAGVDRYRAQELFSSKGLLEGDKGLNNCELYLDDTPMKPQSYWGNVKNKEDFVYSPTLESGYIEIAIPTGTTLSSNYNGMKMTLIYPLKKEVSINLPKTMTPNTTEIIRHSKELEDISEMLMVQSSKNNELKKTAEDIIRETYSIYGNNLISSPTFDNIEDWNLIAANVKYSTKDGAIILKGASNVSRIQQKIDHTDGNLIYRVAMVKSTSNKVGIGATTDVNTKHSGSNEYEMLSSRSRSVIKYTSVVDNRDSNYDDIYIKYIATIDLTKTFGAGNEPSLVRMDHIMSKLGNNIGDLLPMVSLKTSYGILLEDMKKLNKKIDTLYVDTTEIGYIDNPMKDDFKGQAMITMSYDDGYLDNYTRALPLHERYGIPATFNIITNYTPGSNSFMNSSHLLDSFNRGVEIASHSTEHLNMTQQTSPEIHLSMSESKLFLEDIVGKGNINTFAVPYATNTKEVNDIASQYYKGSRVYEVYTNSIPPTNRYALHSPIMVGNKTTFKKIKDIIDLAVQERRWCIIILHSIVKDNPSQYAITEALLEQVLSYINSFDRDKLLPINTVDALKFSLGEDY